MTDEISRDKEFYDEIRREVKEREEKKDPANQVPLEKREGITVFPLKPGEVKDK